MTEKRYSLVYYADKGGSFIKNNETGTEWYHNSRASLLEIVNELNELHEEKETYKTLYEEMSYYFRDGITLRDLDHKDFHRLQRLAKGLVD